MKKSLIEVEIVKHFEIEKNDLYLTKPKGVIKDAQKIYCLLLSNYYTDNKNEIKRLMKKKGNGTIDFLLNAANDLFITNTKFRKSFNDIEKNIVNL